MSISKKTVFFVGLLCACMAVTNVANVYADSTSTTTTQASSPRAWDKVKTDEVKKTLQTYSNSINKQLSVDYDALFKSATLNKTQKERFDRYTSSYKTALKVAKESMNFYLDDLNDVIASNDPDDVKAKNADSIQTKARTDYRDVVSATQTYLSNCSYVMPSLSYQKFLKAFEASYALDDLDKQRFSSMK